MIVIGYLIQYFCISLLQILNKKISENSYSNWNNISILLFLSNKGVVVGSDYEMYNNFFNFYLKEDSFPSFYIKDSDCGLIVYFYVVGKIFKNFKEIVLFIILFHNFIIYYFFKKYCYDKLFYFSFLTYFSMFYINNTFNPMKQ